MNFLLDQSADARLVAWLTERGHDALRVGRTLSPPLPVDELSSLFQLLGWEGNRTRRSRLDINEPQGV